MNLNEAVNVVARYAIHEAAGEFGTPVEWGNYPDMHQDDWIAVTAEVDRLAPEPDPREVTDALLLLEGRAGTEDPS